MKICTECKVAKDESEFGFRSSKSTTRKSKCKKCLSSANARRNKERYDNEPGYKERLSEYRKSNPEKVREWKLKTYNNNREYYVSKSQKWAEQNRTSVRQTKRRYKSKRKQWEMTGSFTNTEWVDLCNQYDNLCLCCKLPGLDLTADHVIPLSRGGSNTIDNIQPLCGSCNSKKHTKTTDYR